MKRKYVLKAFSFLLSLLIFSPLSATDNEYWISYGGRSHADAFPPSGGAKYLTKIDSFGNVLVQPEKVVRNSSIFVSPLGGTSAISHGGLGSLHMWFAAKHSLPDENHRIFKAVIEKSSLRLISMGPTRFSTSDPSNISVTQKPRLNFIVLQVLALFPSVRHDWLARSTTGQGTLWTLQECPGGVDCSFGVSADARVFFFSKRNASRRFEVFFQSLSPRGLPVGRPEEVARGNNAREVLQAFDVTSLLPGGKRHFFYGRAGASLFLQVVDGKSGTKLGEKIRIAANVAEAAADPLGRFVIYVTGAPSSRPLVFQALDPLGNPSGNPKFIAQDIGGGIDILMESP